MPLSFMERSISSCMPLMESAYELKLWLNGLWFYCMAAIRHHDHHLVPPGMKAPIEPSEAPRSYPCAFVSHGVWHYQSDPHTHRNQQGILLSHAFHGCSMHRMLAMSWVVGSWPGHMMMGWAAGGRVSWRSQRGQKSRSYHTPEHSNERKLN